jgi:hypothetical protein
MDGFIVYSTYSKYATRGKGENNGIISNLSCHKVRGPRELELDALHVEYG